MGAVHMTREVARQPVDRITAVAVPVDVQHPRAPGQAVAVLEHLRSLDPELPGPVVAAQCVAALGELPRGERHRRAPGADETPEERVGERERHDDPVRSHASPASGQVPEQREQPDLDPRELGDRPLHGQRRGYGARPRRRTRRAACGGRGSAPQAGIEHEDRGRARTPPIASRRGGSPPRAAPPTACRCRPGPRISVALWPASSTSRATKPLRTSSPRGNGGPQGPPRDPTDPRAARASAAGPAPPRESRGRGDRRGRHPSPGAGHRNATSAHQP